MAQDPFNVRRHAWLDAAYVEREVRRFLAEDVGRGDVTSERVVPKAARARAAMVARQACVVAGLPLARAVFLAVDPEIAVADLASDGDGVAAGAVLARVEGPAGPILTAERVALNLVQRLSGIATLTRAYVDAIAGTGACVSDTRKTTPGLRVFEKYAVHVGGGRNHRMGLYDAILIKDNHRAIAGGAAAAVTAARQANGDRDADPDRGRRAGGSAARVRPRRRGRAARQHDARAGGRGREAGARAPARPRLLDRGVGRHHARHHPRVRRSGRRHHLGRRPDALGAGRRHRPRHRRARRREPAMTSRETDVLVIGSGLAGCAAALAAARGGARVLMLTKQARPEESNTWYAQGGIIYRGKVDSPAQLAADIIAAGDGLCNPAAVDLLAREGPRLVDEVLIRDARVEFDHADDGTGALDLTAEAAHSTARIVHHADATGRSIEDAMLAAVGREPGIELLTGQTAVDLLTLSHHSRNPLDVYAPPTCVGAYVFDQATRPRRHDHGARDDPGHRRPRAHLPAHVEPGRRLRRRRGDGLPRRRALHQHAVRAVPPDDALCRRRAVPDLRVDAGRRARGSSTSAAGSSCATITRTGRWRRATSWRAASTR